MQIPYQGPRPMSSGALPWVLGSTQLYERRDVANGPVSTLDGCIPK